MFLPDSTQAQERRCLIVVDRTDKTSQCLVKIPWDDLKGSTWQL